jgi:hypothetical protein
VEVASIWYEAGDIEGSMFASDIAESLVAAHVRVSPPGGIIKMRYRNGLGRSDVIPGCPLRLVRHRVEVFLDKPFPPRQSVPTAHHLIIALDDSVLERVAVVLLVGWEMIAVQPSLKRYNPGSAGVS